MGCGSPSGSDRDVSEMGIVQGHAYAILAVREEDGIRLLQLRNPWGGTVRPLGQSLHRVNRQALMSCTTARRAGMDRRLE